MNDYNNASLQDKIKMPNLTREALKVLLETLNGAEIINNGNGYVIIKNGEKFRACKEEDLNKWMHDDRLLQIAKDSQVLSPAEKIKAAMQKDSLRAKMPVPEEVQLATRITGIKAYAGLYDLYEKGDYNGMFNVTYSLASEPSKVHCEQEANKLGFTQLSVAVGVAQQDHNIMGK